MTMQVNYQKRKNRGGKGLIPPNPDQWENEHNALDLRDEIGVSTEIALPHEKAFSLLEDVIVQPHSDIPMAQKHLDYLSGAGANSWSGLAMPLQNGDTLVLYNNFHSPSRIRATLMEEFFHLWLGHPPSSIRAYSDSSIRRSFNKDIESVAYCSGAAALVPYVALKKMFKEGSSIEAIASHFNVSQDLVRFRAKLTKLYGKYAKRSKNRSKS